MFIAQPFHTHVRDQIDSVDSVFLEIKDKLINPLICGGAPRDWYFNRLCDDVDIFVDPMDLTEFISFLNENNYQHILLQNGENLPEVYRSNEITSVLSFSKNLIKYQVIVKRTTRDPLLTFPCSLSMITYVNYVIKPTSAFVNSVNRGQIIFYTQTNINLRYIKKITNKFSDFRSLFV